MFSKGYPKNGFSISQTFTVLNLCDNNDIVIIGVPYDNTKNIVSVYKNTYKVKPLFASSIFVPQGVIFVCFEDGSVIKEDF
jgi:hypothetical protein